MEIKCILYGILKTVSQTYTVANIMDIVINVNAIYNYVM